MEFCDFARGLPGLEELNRGSGDEGALNDGNPTNENPQELWRRPRFPRVGTSLSTRDAVQKAKLIQKTWMGTNIVIWCDDKDGRVCVAESVCPHLGSDLGPDSGGCIREGRLICPFHGYEFDTTGQCVATPFADSPKTAKLRVFETQEVLGLIFAWWGIGWTGGAVESSSEFS